jgi:hypothetical protein
MSDVLSDREAVIFYAEQRGYASAMEAERKLHEAHIEAQAAEIERLRSYLDRIEKACEFFTNPEHSELTLRYAHEGTRRLAREALTGGKDD